MSFQCNCFEIEFGFARTTLHSGTFLCAHTHSLTFDGTRLLLLALVCSCFHLLACALVHFCLLSLPLTCSCSLSWTCAHAHFHGHAPMLTDSTLPTASYGLHRLEDLYFLSLCQDTGKRVVDKNRWDDRQGLM